MTKPNKQFQQWLQEAASDPEYMTYGLLCEVTECICEALDYGPETQAELAKRLGISVRRVRRFMGTPVKTTLLNIVKFAQAVGLRVEIKLVPKEANDSG